MAATVIGELSADRSSIILLATGSDFEVAAAAQRLQTLTPLIKPTDPPGALRLPASWPAVVQLSATFGARWRPGPALKAWTAEQVRSRMPVEPRLLVAPPRGFVPRSYQVEAACMIRETGSALIFDEPGTGKSAETVLGLVERHAAGHPVFPVLVIAPNSVVDSWIKEFDTCAPSWLITAWRGTPQRRRKLTGAAHVYVTSYGTARMDAATTDERRAPLMALRPVTVIADEVHLLKHNQTAQSRAVRRLAARATNFIGLSGTPITHALTLDSPLLTPLGWKPMGDVKVGDAVIGANGHPTEVIAVHPQGHQQIFRVTFSDGATVDCTADHLWAVNSRSRRSRNLPNLVLRTDELALPRGRRGPERLFDRSGAPRWTTPTVSAVEMPSVSVPLDPYLLGTLLANGYLASSPEITTPDVEIAEYVRAVLPDELGLTLCRKLFPSKADTYKITSDRVGGSLPGAKRGAPPNAVTAALTTLGLLGCRAWEKFIPEQYLWNSKSVRLNLLRGLVDGDGTSVGSTTTYTTTSPRLAEGVKFLVRSLGGYVTETVHHRDPIRMPQGHTSPARPLHSLHFGLPVNPFRVKRKADTWLPRWRVKGRTINAIERLGIEPVQCITVAAEDGLYVTKDFVVTHNSPGDLWPALVALEPAAFPSKERWVGRYCDTVTGDYSSTVLGLKDTAEQEFRTTLLGRHRRVAKADVLAELPPKVHSVRTVSLPPEWRAAYDALEGEMLAELPDGGELSVMTVLAQLTRLAQLASAAADVETVTEVVPDSETGLLIERKHQKVRLKAPSWKVDALLEVLDERPGQPVVTFAPSRQLMVLAGQAATKAGLKVGYIMGGQTAKERTANVDAFQRDEMDLICVTTGAGGVGLTLTAARTCVFLQRPWSLVEAMQAEDRLHRIGAQKHESIEIVDIVAKNTIDARIRTVLRERAGQLADLVQDRRIVTELLGGAEVRDLRRKAVAA